MARLAAGGARPRRTAAAGGNAGDETGAAIGAADVSRSALGKRDGWVRESANRRSDARSHSGIRGGSRFPVPGGGAASAVQSHGRTAPPDSDLRGGFVKVRTGGLTPEAIPESEAVADFLCRAAARRLPFKATAGLHHPIRSLHPLTYADRKSVVSTKR